MVVGADGLHSLVARTVSPEQYHEKPQLEASYYSYWSGLPMNGRFEAYDRGDRAWAAWPTNDDLTLVIVGWPFAEFEANKTDVEGHYLEAFERAPAFAERIRAARREERFVGAAVPNFFRKPFGPGWALVGDAGYNKDFITAQGISDAFRDAELCANALDESLLRDPRLRCGDGRATNPRATSTSCRCTSSPASSPCSRRRRPRCSSCSAPCTATSDAMDGFARVIAGVTSPAEFFSEENVGRIFAATAQQP